MMTTIKPISPDELGAAAFAIFPPAVFEVVNGLIVAKWNGTSANIKQDTIISKLAEALDLERWEIFKKGYLNFEEAYRSQGWKVTYNKPGYSESYEANFTFRKA